MVFFKNIRFAFMFLIYLIVLFIYYIQSEGALIDEAVHKIEQTLINHQAIRRIIRTLYLPELDRMKAQGILDKEYANPLFTSGTFATQKLHDFTIPLQLKLSKEATRFKYASLNPLNMANQASGYEETILHRMQEHKVESFSEVIKEGEKRYLFYATFFQPIEKGCLRCHGDPKDAPLNQVKRYGNTHGYHFKVGDFSSLITMRTPLEESLDAMHQNFVRIALLVLVVFVLIYVISEWVIRRLERQKEKLDRDRKAREALLCEINKDPLTGLLNRRGFDETLMGELNRAKRDNKYFAFFLLDIDFFKQYNDTYGHIAGDEALQKVADSLSGYFKRSHESIYRLGGEEFGVVSSDRNIENIMHWADKILENVQELHIEHIKSPYNRLTISLGLYVLSPYEKKVTAKDIMEGADKALYEAKANGRNQVLLYKG